MLIFLLSVIGFLTKILVRVDCIKTMYAFSTSMDYRSYSISDNGGSFQALGILMFFYTTIFIFMMKSKHRIRKVTLPSET
jgi:hypothetical protein